MCQNPPMKGHKHSKESNEKNRQSHLGKTSPMKGRKHSEESKEKNRQSHLGKHPTAETLAKLKGRKSWNKGLTKETDKRIKIISEKNSKRKGSQTSFFGKHHSKEVINGVNNHELKHRGLQKG
jgi:hypothetical protein